MEKFEKRERIILIKEAAPGDAEGVSHVQEETWLATYPNEEYGITREDIEASIAARHAKNADRWRTGIEDVSGNRHLWVAKDEQDRMVGFCSVRKTTDENNIRAIYVLPNAQRWGVGKKLMNEALEWLGPDKPVRLSVAPYNSTAIEFYKKCGFEEAGAVPSSEVAILPSGKMIPEIKMIKAAAT